MKIEKLPSNSYRIRKMYKGKMHTVIFDYKPTQKEAMHAMAEELDNSQLDIQTASKCPLEIICHGICHKKRKLKPTLRFQLSLFLFSLF